MANAFLRHILAACVLLSGAGLAWSQPAQPYPTRVITWIVPYGPGGGGDISSRIIAQKLGPLLGQTVVVENRVGASGIIGTAFGAKAKPDGYTWTMASDPPFTIHPQLMKMPFDPVNDFEPVSFILRLPLVLVINSEIPVSDLKQFVAHAAARPGKLTIGSSGNGSSGHLSAELFKTMAGVDMLHVPYKDQGAVLNDMIAGRIDATFSSVGSIQAFLKAGKLKAVGIGTLTRFEGLPNLPTIAEQGYPGFDVSAWQGLLMPAGTPKAIVAQVSELMRQVLQMKDVSDRLSGMGLMPVGGGPQDLANLIKTDSAKWGKVIRDAKITTN